MPDGKFRDNMLTIKLVIPVTSVADPLLCTLPQAPVLEGAGHHFCEGEHSYKQTNKQRFEAFSYLVFAVKQFSFGVFLTNIWTKN